MTVSTHSAVGVIGSEPTCSSWSVEGTVNSTNAAVVRIEDFVQRAGPSPIGDLSGTIYGSGMYNGADLALLLVEKATSESGPWDELTPLTSDPAYDFPSNASASGVGFVIPLQPEDYVSEGLWFRITVDFVDTGIDPVVDANGAFDWDPEIIPDAPASIVVPDSSSDGDFQVSWSSVEHVDGYELQEGIQQGDGPITWGTTWDVGNVLYKDLTGKPTGYTYWYRVRSYNAAYSSEWRTSSNGCLVEEPALYISPDLGWANRYAMLDIYKNNRLAVFPLDDLDQVEQTPDRIKTPATLYFDIDGVIYQVPATSLVKLGASGKYWWRGPSGDMVDYFILRVAALSAGKVPEVPEARRVQLPVIS